MTLEQQVASLELSQKLKELGYPQEGIARHFHRLVDGKDCGYAFISNITAGEMLNSGMLVRPTVAELGEWLPMSLPGDYGQIFTNRWQNNWLVGYPDLREDDVNYSDTEANARAECLIWLVENKYINFEGE